MTKHRRLFARVWTLGFRAREGCHVSANRKQPLPCTRRPTVAARSDSPSCTAVALAKLVSSSDIRRCPATTNPGDGNGGGGLMKSTLFQSSNATPPSSVLRLRSPYLHSLDHRSVLLALRSDFGEKLGALLRVYTATKNNKKEQAHVFKQEDISRAPLFITRCPTTPPWP